MQVVLLQDIMPIAVALYLIPRLWVSYTRYRFSVLCGVRKMEVCHVLLENTVIVVLSLFVVHSGIIMLLQCW